MKPEVDRNSDGLVKWVIQAHDLLNDYVLRIIAYNRWLWTGDKNLSDSDEVMKEARRYHVDVWRDFDLLQTAFESVYDPEEERKYKYFLMGKGLTKEDAEDVLQEISEYTVGCFEKWLPWKSGYYTWHSWLGKWKIRAYFDEMKRQRANLSFDSAILDGDTNELDTDDPAVARGDRLSKKEYSILQTALAVFDDETDNPSIAIIGKVIERLRCGDAKSGDMADILEHALELGESFTGLHTQLFLDSIEERFGLNRRQLIYRMEKSGVKEIARRAETEEMSL